MNRLMIDSLEDCLRLLEAGIPLEECLGDCQEYRAEIRELLVTAKAVRSLSVDEVPAASIDKGRKKLSSQRSGVFTNDLLENY